MRFILIVFAAAVVATASGQATSEEPTIETTATAGPMTSSPRPVNTSPATSTASPVPKETSPVPSKASPTPVNTSPVPSKTSPVPTETSARPTTPSDIFGRCGQTPIKPDLTHVNTKIVGGDIAVPYSWPWQVVWCTKTWLSENVCPLDCGGSVIAPGWVMTAGHCVYDDLNPRNYKVKAGVFDEARSDEDAEQVVTVKAIHLHPDYNNRKTNYDVALIELSTPLVYGDHIQPVCLPKTDAAIRYPGDLWVTGWGTTREHGKVSRELRQADIPIVPLPICEREYPRKIDEKVEFCAGKRGVDSCQGDSGGPVVAKAGSGSWFQYGIVSWGKGCAERGDAGVYSRVSAYCDWIKRTTKSAVQCQDVV